MSGPTHGQERNRRQESTHNEPVEFVGANIGRFSMPTVFVSMPVSERWCETCGEWKPQRGIVAMIVGCPDCGREW